MYNNALAVLFAFASAMTIAWGTVVRHRIAEELPGNGETLGDSPILAVISRPLWWAGTFCALLGYAFQIVALGFGTLLIVQPVLVLKLMLTLPLAAKYAGKRITFGEMFWATVLSIAVGVMVIWGRPLAGAKDAPAMVWIISLTVGIVVLVAIDRYAHMQFTSQKALLLGIVTGAVFGYVAVLSKAAVDEFVHHGFLAGMMSWQTYALIIGAAIGTAVQQSSFSAGDLKNSLPAMTISEPIVAFSLGYLILGERFQVHGSQWILMGIALAAMIMSTVILARREA